LAVLDNPRRELADLVIDAIVSICAIVALEHESPVWLIREGWGGSKATMRWGLLRGSVMSASEG